MKIVKYDKSRSGNASGGGGYSGGSSSSTEAGRGVSLDRTLWGQADTGDDINGSMTIYGSVNIKSLVYEDDDEDVGGEDDDVENEIGVLNVDDDVSVGKDVHVGRHLYIKHSHSAHNTQEVCVSQLIKSCEDNIATNKSDISNLKSRMSTAETYISNNTTNITSNKNEIDELKKKVTDNTTDINNHETNITDIQNFINNNSFITQAQLNEILNDYKYGQYSRPVILASGKIRKSSVTGSTFWFSDMNYLDSLNNITLSYEGGLMKLSFQNSTRKSNTEKATNMIYCVHANQMKSGETGDINVTSMTGRSDGAHWFETKFDNSTNSVYIREFHQGNGDNDTWKSDYWGGEGGGVQEVAVTIIGYAYWTPVS